MCRSPRKAAKANPHAPVWRVAAEGDSSTWKEGTEGAPRGDRGWHALTRPGRRSGAEREVGASLGGGPGGARVRQGYLRRARGSGPARPPWSRQVCVSRVGSPVVVEWPAAGAAGGKCAPQAGKLLALFSL